MTTLVLSYILEETKTTEYPELGLACRCHQTMFNWHNFQKESTQTSSGSELHSLTSTEGKIQVIEIYQIMGKFVKDVFVCLDSDGMILHLEKCRRGPMNN